MNTNDRGQNLAEARHFRASQAATRRPSHGGHPDPRCACAGTGYVVDAGEVIPCPEHVLARCQAMLLPAVPDPRGPVAVEWESVAGRALADLQAAANELKRLRSEMPADALREYDRRHHPDA
jgi:hypothetical protein